ncbi:MULTISPECIES: hypothetical protein [unclassified Leeuwenhoekiella]|uniref:hypothetical protein n=1 Tax=unclassified Leeuwenhoekiella TaxID=2615029 RepID=UPI000C4CC493|nr:MULTISPECIES: hypothetical protein [unclassified Leeuwenhoekiella]MBA80428.1 hypothetical protein [Leeuwenhoekiella sp.]|tara:strand:+ start:14765 stop:15256 length:492 start_codon:yes stop_codon:yes gene_type:complete
MKKLALILTIMISCTAFAQRDGRQDRLKKMMEASPEEMADIQTKRLTLALVLDDKQLKAIYDLELAAAKERKAHWQERAEKMKSGEKPTEEERAAMRENRKDRYAAMLDKQIAHQEKMQKILNEEQFDQWRKMKMKQKQRMTMRDGKRRERPEGRRRTNGERK